MKTAKVVCAAPHVEGWHSIDWRKAQRNVKRLQVRIAKATMESRHGKVKALQWMLTHSFSGKAVSVKRVTENRGKKTPGVDKETWSTPETKFQGIAALKRRDYKPHPLRRVLIPKSNGKMRPLGIPTIKDRAMQALHLLALEPVAEVRSDKNSYGFRPSRATADAMAQGFTILVQEKCAQWILEGDIKACFDEISHDWLLENVPMNKQILKSWLKAGYVHQKKLFPTEAGNPQGGIISPCLANLALDGLEKVLTKQFPSHKGGKRQKINFIRYADDFIVTGATKELLTEKVKPTIEEFLRTRGLELSQEKTRVTHIKEGFDFLGWNFRKYSDKLLIMPSAKNIDSFLADIRKTLKDNKQAKQENIIRLLNPKIRGWANYHQPVVAKETFSTVDGEIWKSLWQWAKRRHPGENASWIKKRYFSKKGKRDWIFTVKINDKTGNSRNLTLLKASDTKIRRHVKIKADANPFDRKWELYFEERLFNKMKNTPKGKKMLQSLWVEQKGKCLICKTMVAMDTDEHNVHHILPRCEGGKDIISNLVLLHGNCHRQVHSQKLEVLKPVAHSSAA